jgi:hypothetical protein
VAISVKKSKDLMKKIKITENQKGMLDKAGARLQESIPPSQSPSLKVTKAFKSATKGLGIKTENTEDVVIGGLEWAELVPHVLEFIKKLYTNPSKEGLDPFWGQVGLTWDEMVQMLTRLDLIKSVSGGYRLTKFVNEPIKNVKIVGRILEKMVNDKNQPQEVMPETVEKTHTDIANSFRQQVSEPKKTGKTRQELLDVIAQKRQEELKRREGGVKHIGEADWFDNHPDHPANQVDNTERGIRPELSPYNIVWFSDDVAIFSKDGQFFAFNVSSTDNDEYAEYADREAMDMGQDEDGFADIEYGDWTLDADVVSAYVNNNADHLNFGKGLDDYDNGVDMSLITQDLAADLVSFANYIGGEQGAKLNQILTTINLEEVTSAAGSSGAFVGKMGGSPAPIHKGNVSSEMDMITDAEVDEFSVERDIINTLKGFMKDTKISPTEWFVFESGLKRVVDMIQSLNNEEWNPVIMFIVKTLQISEAIMSGDNSGVDKFRGYIRSLRQFVNHFAMSLGESTTVTSVGGDSGTFAFDAPVGDGGEFWTAGNKMAKKDVNEDAKTDTQYPKGEFVEFDDCVKYNNNKVAQNGGCSVGAVDNVVKTRSSKNSVISDNALYLEISKATGRSISEVKSLIENKIK